jgi:hypothetical protein
MDVRSQQPEAAAPVRQASTGRTAPGGTKLLVLLLTILAVFALVFSIWRVAGSFLSDKAVNTKEYQAVFLPDNVVYFGKLSHVDGDYVKLTDIYYLQQSSTSSTSSTVQPANSADTQVSLVKLGSELHAPEDAMYIAKDQVVFWENLKNTGKVAQAIQQYKAANK